MSANATLIRRAKAVFQCAVELDQRERAGFVADACGEDASLRSMVESLLGADSAAPESFGHRTAAKAAHAPVVVRPVPPGYEAVRPLGHGGSGFVDLCRHATTGQLHAVKTIDLTGLGESGLERVRREWRILSAIRHEALVSLRAAGRVDDRFAYLVMDYIDGPDVRAYATLRRLDARAATALLLPIAEALALAHAHGVVHRDLKPSNILVGPDGRARLLDFGAARIGSGGAVSVHRHTLTGEMVGTLSYMSPEQAAGRAADVDGRTDIYQLAAVLYELVEGRPPYEFDGLTLAETITTIVRARPRAMQRSEREGGASPALARTVMRALSKRPDARHADMESFIRALAVAARTA
jgi:serine/threonine protein kinase